MTLETSTGNIYGTLSMPDGEGVYPIAVLVAGSGPTDRDGNNAMGIRTDNLKLIAETLRAEGIASLRFDKRGIGASAASMGSESDMILDTYADDVRGWIKMFVDDERFSGIIVIGHSEGAQLAVMAAIGDSAVDKLVAVSGAGEPIGDILRRQLAAYPEPLKSQCYGIIEKLEKGEAVPDVPGELQALFRPSVQPFLMSWMRADPAQDMSMLSLPILVVQGTTDIQVTVGDAERLAKSNPNAELAIIENMNHTLKDCSSTDPGAQNPTYTDPSLPLNKQFVAARLDFLKK